MKKIKKILIANRGEIALRIIKTCQELQIKTVTLFTKNEIALPHALLSDYSVNLGDGPLHETYLNHEKIIEIAKQEKVDAIHPGYGFLSENSFFAKKVTDNNIIFIGPTPESMNLMGDKKRSKENMGKINIPLIPGYHGDNQNVDFLEAEAYKIGYPVLIKASAGGGGKGMRIVHKESEFKEALAAAKREAKNSFGDDLVLIEKYIINPRHIEVQVMSDTHGNHLHFYERECSIQRRHQKIIEETPSTALDDEVRNAITKVATKITSSINYIGAGTIEFILDQDGSFYFLEMNTRLQVEHPITEMVTGFDLVKLQIKVAQGEKLKLKQDQIKQSGHALEVRIYAEDPDNNFLPSIGTIIKTGKPSLNDVRLDSGYANNNEVTVDFDPMLAKLITHGKCRKTSIDKMKISLNEVSFQGIKTNREYLHRILSLFEFEQGLTFTNFVETNKDKLSPADLTDDEIAAAIAALNLFNNNISNSSSSAHKNSTTKITSWDTLGNFRNC